MPKGVLRGRSDGCRPSPQARHASRHPISVEAQSEHPWVSCKIRLLETMEATVELARIVESCGVCALGVHGRTTEQRSREPAAWDRIADVVRAVKVPVIANGDVFTYEDFDRAREATGAAAVMAARGALWNASIFRKDGVLPLEQVKREFLHECLRWDNPIPGTKYVVREMLIHSRDGIETPEGRALAKCKTLKDLAQTYSLVEEHGALLRQRTCKRKADAAPEDSASAEKTDAKLVKADPIERTG
mmetsp:Transcript_1010/g.3754  ORF Transcript_1010/g.3754 Transcript_1010/m.3754 type:complete len:246 (-) Transcript_1010:758-1495(-)